MTNSSAVGFRRHGRISITRLTPAVLLGTAALVWVQALVASRGQGLPGEPDYTVGLTVPPGGRSLRDTPGPVMALVMLGDSTVAGMGAATSVESLPAQVAQRVADRLGRPVHVVGHGMCGARTADVTSEQVPRLLDAKADIVAIVVGSNDVAHLTPFWDMRRGTERLLAAVRDRTDAPVVLGGIPQFRTVPRLPQPLRFLAGVYANALREPQRAAATSEPGVRYVDIAAQASPRFLGRPESMSADGYHPSAVGYGLWADALAPAIVEALSEKAAGAARS